MRMLEQSFIFLDRMSLAGERRLWDAGVHSWDDFLSRENIQGIGALRKQFYDHQLLRAKELFRRRDMLGLATLLPHNQHWRLYDLFRERALALDIETSGYYGDITVIGLHDGAEGYFLVKNKNLSFEPLDYLLREERVLLTFNGSSFDLPVVARCFPQVRNAFARQLHIDLRHVAAKLGLTGGLKTIEIILGIQRTEEVRGLSGDVAVLLWRLYESEGDEEALRLLLEYNREDVENLFILADKLIPRLWEKMRPTSS